MDKKTKEPKTSKRKTPEGKVSQPREKDASSPQEKDFFGGANLFASVLCDFSIFELNSFSIRPPKAA